MPYLIIEDDHEDDNDPPLMYGQVVANSEALGPCSIARVKFARVWPAMLFEGEALPDTWPGAS